MLNSLIPFPDPIEVKDENPLVVATYQALAYPLMKAASDSENRNMEA